MVSTKGQLLQLGTGNGDTIAISNLLSPTEDQQQQSAGFGSGPGSESAPAPLSTSAPPPPPTSDTGADAGSEPAVNPRKRKKASRA